MRNRFSIVFAVLLAVAGGGCLVGWLWGGDEINVEMQNYIRENKDVESRLGKVEGLTLRTKLNAGDAKGRYRRYTYYVKGEHYDAAVEVYMRESELDKAHKEYSLGKIREFD